MKKLLYFSLVAISLASCSSVTKITREEVSAPVAYMSRSDYELSDDLSASAKVSIKSFLFVNVIRWNDQKQIRVFNWTFGSRNYYEGSFNNYYYPKDFDEKVAIYNFNEKYKDLDYVTNVRFKRSVSRSPYLRSLNIGKREMTTEVIAKGINLKTKNKK
ncbi:MAG: hypothetical protein ACK5D5_03650 [Bacteroidota bacterium]|jgi:hypothetical protein